MKEIRHITCGIFYCRDSAGFSVSASNKRKDSAQKSATKTYRQNVVAHFKKTHPNRNEENF